MKLTASDFYGYHRPSKCGLRLYLRQQRIEEAEAGPYAKVLERLGQRHEKEHLGTFPEYEDLSTGTIADRAARTLQAVKEGTPVIYQGVLTAEATIDGTKCDITGVPDFLVRQDGGGYVVRDSKMSRRITEKDHREIILQLGLYGWLYEQAFSKPPAGLEVHGGTGDIVPVPYDGGTATLDALGEVAGFKYATSEPFSPVGWSKCGGCGYHNRCWHTAEKSRDVALVPGVDQGLVRGLREEGVKTISQLLDSFDEDSLSGFSRPWGKGTQRVGKKAASILRSAEAIASNKEIMIQPPDVPDC